MDYVVMCVFISVQIYTSCTTQPCITYFVFNKHILCMISTHHLMLPVPSQLNSYFTSFSPFTILFVVLSVLFCHWIVNWSSDSLLSEVGPSNDHANEEGSEATNIIIPREISKCPVHSQYRQTVIVNHILKLIIIIIIIIMYQDSGFVVVYNMVLWILTRG